MCLPSLPKSFLVALAAAAPLVTAVTEAQSSSAGTATSVHVDFIETSFVRVYFSGPVRRAEVYPTTEVVVADDLGNPVEGALVTGTFSGDLMKKDETVAGVTGPGGSATLSTSKAYRYLQSGPFVHYFTFCVDDVSVSLPYNPADDVATCDTVTFWE